MTEDELLDLNKRLEKIAVNIVMLQHNTRSKMQQIATDYANLTVIVRRMIEEQTK